MYLSLWMFRITIAEQNCILQLNKINRTQYRLTVPHIDLAKQMTHFRSFQLSPMCNWNVIIVGVGIFVCYFAYIFLFLVDLKASWKLPAILVSIPLLFMLVWSFFRVYLTEPGRVPSFWAVEPEQTERSLKRKYCTICHNFKPQRVHHCSTCNKCVLNMDHHCPWVHNCIGLYNRKFFMLFIIYLVINLFYVAAQEGYLLVRQMVPIIKSDSSTNVGTAFRLIFFIGELILIFPITTFIGYNFTMIFQNMTTLEEMIKERMKKEQKDGENEQIEEENVYDIGKDENISQVFGNTVWKWWLPLDDSFPCDGINWPRNDMEPDYEEAELNRTHAYDHFEVNNFNKTKKLQSKY